jgi:predicted O-methyltransferase YrrM
MMKVVQNALSFVRRYSRLSSLVKAVKNPREAVRRVRLEVLTANDPRNAEAFDEAHYRNEDTDPEEFFMIVSELRIEAGDELDAYVQELESSEAVTQRLNRARNLAAEKPYVLGGMDEEGVGLYALVRAIQPDRAVEIGVANGVSSLYVLAAMEMNGHGTLVSIDKPKYEADHEGDWHDSAGAWIPTGREVGWVVPEVFRDNWNVIVGDMRDELSRVLEGDSVDLFVYDGPKAYHARFWALQEAYASATPSTVFVCDDLLWNSAFEDFCKAEGLIFVQWGDVGFAMDTED